LRFPRTHDRAANTRQKDRLTKVKRTAGATTFDFMLAAAALWSYWLAMVLVGGVVAAIIATAIGYYVKVIANKSHRRKK
jgi:predicted lysophospholipase L1 biosynthesis ABC-type transport system permease subunit